jgi:hypothetical protein
MGSIRELQSGREYLLEPEHVVGRGPTCALRLERKYISAQHAALRWTGNHWDLRDLGSRNGTFLDGVRLRPGEEHALQTGSQLAFGKASDEKWELTDASPPMVMAIPVKGGDPVVLDGDMIALPSADEPLATIYRAAEGGWVLEQADDSTTRITNLQTFEVAGRLWRFSCSESMRTTSVATTPLDVEIRHVHLSFAVSRDEEHVQLHVSSAGRTFDMGARCHNYLLLTLARRRASDASENLPDTSCGWTYQEDLARDPTMAPPQLNIDVFRIRRQFAAIGVVDAANIIERRPRTRQLRIGTAHITITTL